MEACVALMTSSVPAIYPLFRRPERREDFSNPPPPMREPTKEWESHDSQDGTAVPSTAQTDLSSKRWSLLSKAESVRDKLRWRESNDPRHMTTIKSEAARTELKSMFEEEEGKDFVPGLAPR